MDDDAVPQDEKEVCTEDHAVVKTSKKAVQANIWNAIIPLGVLIVSGH